MNLGDACINTRIMRVALMVLCIEVNASLESYSLPFYSTLGSALALASMILHV